MNGKVEKMSLREKATIFTGRNEWETEPVDGKSIFLSDGPHGIRKEEIGSDGKKSTVKAVCYPAACLSACSFDTELFERYGEELARECIRHGVDVLLGPGINIKRNPLCGRNFEYFSEDPLLSGKLAAHWIEGVQKRNVGTSLKHFALNSQETGRLVNSSVADEKALREIYLRAFEIAVKEAHPWTVMASYNLIDGVHSTENKRLLTDILRREFGFDGIVVSDWGAILDPVKSIEAGLDLEMPGLSKGSAKRILEAVENGDLSRETLDESTERMLLLKDRTSGEKTDDFDEEHALSVAREIAENSMVLLKNRDNILPLNREQKILIVGDFAEHPRCQGGGSSEINPIYIDSLIGALKDEDIEFEYARGYDAEALAPDMKLIEEACSKAEGKDAVVVMCGLPRALESEGFDRSDMKMPESHLRLIKELCRTNENMVVVLQNGSPVEMPFLPDVKALLETYLGGSMHGEVIRDILFGRVNPSGRLAETFPLSYDDVPSKDFYLRDTKRSLYKESVYVGYRYYDKAEKDVLFPFGYGLSYSDTYWDRPSAELKDGTVTAEVSVRNLSDRSVRETVQVYAGLLETDGFRPRKELRAFTKVTLEPGEEKRVALTFPESELSYWSLSENRWVLREGTYRIYLSRHSYDETLFSDIHIVTGERVTEEYPVPYGTLERPATDKEFFSLLPHEPDEELSIRPFGPDSTIEDLMTAPFIRFCLKPFLKKLIRSEKDPNDREMVRKALPSQPIRSLQMMFSLSKTGIEGLIDIFNGHLIKGLKKLKVSDDI